MSEKHLPYIGGNFDRIVFEGDGSTWVREQSGTRYLKLFGTPERAARTLEAMELDSINWCNDDSGNHRVCKACPYEYDYYGCYLPDGFSLLEWLRGDA